MRWYNWGLKVIKLLSFRDNILNRDVYIIVGISKIRVAGNIHYLIFILFGLVEIFEIGNGHDIPMTLHINMDVKRSME